MRGRKVTIRRRSVLPSNRISIGSTMRETVAPRGSSRTSKHRAPRRRLIPRDIIRLWIIRGTRRTRTFRSANHANRYVILTSRCFVCPLAIESRPCLCRRCRRSRRRSTDRRAIESERRWLLICTAKRGSIETIPRHCSLRNATRRKRKNFFFLFFYSGENYSSLHHKIFEIIRPNTNEFRFSVFAGILGGEINRGEWRARSIHDIR